MKKNESEKKAPSAEDRPEHQALSLTDICVVCGVAVPEGRWICPCCEKGIMAEKTDETNAY